MDIEAQFETFSRHFDSSTPILSASMQAQRLHATKVQEWLRLTASLDSSGITKRKDRLSVLARATKSAKSLFGIGDDISAWLGQSNIATVAEEWVPGLTAALYLSWAARFAVFMSLHQEAEELLDRMQQHFNESHHPIAAQYWTIKGILLRLKRRWMDAIPYFQLAYEHIEQCSIDEIKTWFDDSREDLLSNRLQLMTDCWINLAWQSNGHDRSYFIKQASKNIRKSNQLTKILLEQALISLNEMELKLLESKIDEVRHDIDDFLGQHILNSKKAATLRPAAYCMLARIADMEGDVKAIVAHLSRALSESTIFPHALQETIIVDFALDLIQRHALRTDQSEALFHAMVVMLEAKDWYTGHGHSKFVADYTIQLWKTWQPVTSSVVDEKQLYLAGYLHDIGKIRLPRSLLNKIAPLCDKERKLIQRHPSFSQEICNAMGAHHLSDLVREHHQDAKGTGYPGNQPASQLGLCIAIADIVEAATSCERLYKKPRQLQEVISEIKERSPDRYPGELLNAAELIVTRR